jgi:hypothetical protein
MSDNFSKMCKTFGLSPDNLALIQKQHAAIANPVDACCANSAHNWLHIDARDSVTEIRQHNAASPQNVRSLVGPHFPVAPTPVVA